MYICTLFTYTYCIYIIYVNLTISVQTSRLFCTKPQSCGDGSIGIKGEGSLSSKAAKGAKEKKKNGTTTVEPKKLQKISFKIQVCIYIYKPKSHMSFVFFWLGCLFFWGGGGEGLGSKNKYALSDCRVITIRYK